MEEIRKVEENIGLPKEKGASALNRAAMGDAMRIVSSDVSNETAGIILVDDNCASVVIAIEAEEAKRVANLNVTEYHTTNVKK